MKNRGFTIVELLIVIVVIAILAAITIVAYNGIQNRAKQSAAQSAVSQASKKIMAYAVQNSDQFPEDLASLGISNSNETSYLFSSDNSSSGRSYCVTAINGNFSSYISSTNGGVKTGTCPGHWDKSIGGPAGTPISSANVDTSVFRTSTASMRYSPNASGTVRASPIIGSAGQTLTLGFWMKTDANWNGSSSNSKIRFGDTLNGGALLGACGYNGVKTSWTFVSCSYTYSGGVTSVTIGVANDGSTGNIWLDDLNLSYPGM